MKRLALLGALLAFVLITAIWWFFARPQTLTANLPSLLREVQALSELASVKYRVQKVVGIEEQKPYAGAERLLLIVQADVLAGVDLNGLQATNLEWTGRRRVLLHLPAPKILRVVLDDKQTKVWDRSITWWTPWVPFNPDLERQARLRAIESIEADALEMGILLQARKNAEASISRLLQALGMEAVSFRS
jgi:Protein of unknown function (DUF4230)